MQQQSELRQGEYQLVTGSLKKLEQNFLIDTEYFIESNSVQLISWEEVKEQITRQKENSVLLGNGFAIGYKGDSFTQNKIFEQMPSLKGKSDIKDIEECIGTTVDLITETSQTASKEFVAMWVEDAMRREFIEALFKTMLKSIKQKEDFNEYTLKSYKEFLSNFGKTFTLNYDPLLYWMSMYFIENGNQKFVDYIRAKKDLESVSKDSEEFTEKQKICEDTYQNCLNDIKTDTLIDCMKSNSYRLKICFGEGTSQECVFDEGLKDIENFVTAEGYKKISEKIYENMSREDISNKCLSEEACKINNYINKKFETRQEEVKVNDDGINIDVNDGFNKSRKWTNKNNCQKIFYMHGAYHMFTNKNNEIFKATAKNSNSDSTMIKEIKSKMDEEYLPLTVLESNPDKKKEKIVDNPYLKHCFETFENISGNLVTFGVSFMQSDAHIIEAINKNSNIQNIYIGYHEDKPKKELTDLFKDDSRVKFFNTQNILS